MADAPTIKLTDLLHDRCNFKDRVFEQFVRDWMLRHMPSVPLDLLGHWETEQWQHEMPSDRFVPREMTIHVWECPECGETQRWLDFLEPPEPESCCPLVNLAMETDMTPGEVTVTAVVNTEDRDYAIMDDLNETWKGYFIDEVALVTPDTDVRTFVLFVDESMSSDTPEDICKQMSSESAQEDLLGFPWANNTVYLPDDMITNDDLHAAGFIVSSYQPDSSYHDYYRTAGIDGGGYSFTGHHFAPLVAVVSQRLHHKVKTEKGLVYITND